MNIKNLKLLVKRLEAQLDSPEAARFNMSFFGNAYSPKMRGVLQEPVCNTQACLAGETVLALGLASILPTGGLSIDTGEIGSTAGNALKLTFAQRERLFMFKTWTFSHRGWPKKFEESYSNATTPQGRLYVAIRRVERFIKTKGKE